MDSKRPDVLVLDAMGVIFEEGNDIENLLLPFIRERGGTREAHRVKQLYREASLGNLSAENFWVGVGLSPDVEDEYLQYHRLSEGLISFLIQAKPIFKEIWCLSNDVSEWSKKLRRRFELSEYFAGWIVSGDVHCRKPDSEVYFSLIKSVGLPAERILLVDDRSRNLDTASSIGLMTMLLDSKGSAVPGCHRVIHGLWEVFELIRS